MIIKVTELCEHDNGEGIRVVYYEVEDANTLSKALQEYEENFNSNNIISSNDDFEEECNDSEIINVEKVENFIGYK